MGGEVCQICALPALRPLDVELATRTYREYKLFVCVLVSIIVGSLSTRGVRWCERFNFTSLVLSVV